MVISYDSYENSKRRKLDMDANSIISAFIGSSNQYAVNQNEDNLMQLQRHLEILVCLTTTSSDLGFFQTGNPLASQCITHIVNIFLDSNAKFSLIPRALSVLQNLCECSQLNKNLQSVFHLHSAISVFLQHHGIDFKDPLVVQCLNLLEKITYDINIDYIESHFENLIDVLLQLIDNESSQLRKTALRILSNIIRHNVNVQNYICTLPNFKQSLKKIVAMLNTEQPHVLVYALSILANLTPNYPKFWTEEHLTATFKIIIKLLFSTDEGCAIAALDLFLDLIKVPKYQCYFVKSPYLSTFFKKIPKILDKNPIEQSILYLQILNALINIPDCSKKVCSTLCASDNENAGDTNSAVKIHPKIADWCTSDKNYQAHKLSLQLLKSFLIINIDTNFNVVQHSVKEIVEKILKNMTLPSLSDSSMLEKQLEAHVTIFEILILICLKSDLKSFVFNHINLTVCEGIVKMLLDRCKVEECEGSVGCIDLFLMICEIIMLTKNAAPDSEKVTINILQDLRAMQFLAYSLTSNNNDRVKRGLLLVSLIRDDTSLKELSKNLLICNSNIQKRLIQNAESSDISFISDVSQPAKKCKMPLSDSFEKSIDSLIRKIEQGLNIKELKRSEIMELYEHKIAILTRKEQELQNYVEAKTAALQKADQIMTQYKCRQADSDAEALRLRTMLKDYESRCEKATLQYEVAQKECKKQKEELDRVLFKVNELQQSQREQKELIQTQMSRQYEQKKCFEEEKARISELLTLKDAEKKALANQLQQMEEEIKLKCKAYEILEESRDELVKKVDDIKKSTEKMKQNFEQRISDLEKALESAQQSIFSLEEDKENLTVEMNKKCERYNQQILELESNEEELKEQLKLKDSKIADLNETIQKISDQLTEKNDDLKHSELLNSKLRLSIENLENGKTKLEQDVKMLELLCKRYEASIEKKDSEIKELTDELEDVRKQCEEEIQEKEDQIKELEGELEKHKQITGMIHAMTSKIPPPKTKK